MNLFSNNRRTVNVKLIIIGALMAPMSVISTSVFSSEKISDKKIICASLITAILFKSAKLFH